MARLLSVCINTGCPNLTSGGRCASCARTSSRNHRGVPPSQRGHGAAFRLDVRHLIGQPCALRLPGCTGVGQSGDYTRPGDWSSPLQPACLHCQRAQGAALATAARRA